MNNSRIIRGNLCYLNLCFAFLFSCCHDDISQQHQECHEDADHLCGIFLWLYPELTEEVESSEHFYRHPEHHYRSYSHAYVGTP